MRLIDADALIKELHEALDGSGYDEDYRDMGIDDFVLSQKTAYDIEKVVRELEKPYNNTVMAGKWFTTVDRAIEIVKAGGVNDD